MICVCFCFNVQFNPRQRCWASPGPDTPGIRDLDEILEAHRMAAFSLLSVFQKQDRKQMLCYLDSSAIKDSDFSLWAWHMPLTGETHWLNTAVSANTHLCISIFRVLLDISCSFKVSLKREIFLESELKPRPCLGVWGLSEVALSVHSALKVYEYVCACD